MAAATREGFVSMRACGLNWDSLPLRLFQKGNEKFWNPADIDFTQDVEDWAGLSEEQRRASTYLAAMFIAGEESVTHDLQPFMAAMAREERLGDEMYLTQFCFEEAKHVQVFRLMLDAIGLREDLHRYVRDNPGYRAIFYDALPRNLRALHADPGPAAQVRASVTYNHVVEGVLALTGYHAFGSVLRALGVMPGLQEVIRRIGDDERRHMAWGTFTCRRHVAADDSNWAVVEDTMDELLPHAVKQITYVFRELGEMPFDIDLDELVEYALDKGRRRLGSIESARGADLASIDLDMTPEHLEERFHAEDEARAAALPADQSDHSGQ